MVFFFTIFEKNSPCAHILYQMDPAHTLQRDSFKQVLKLPSHQRLGLPSYLFPSAFSNKKFVCISVHSSACHMTISVLLVFTMH